MVFTEQSVTFIDSSMVEHSAVNRRVVGSSPTRGAQKGWGTVRSRLSYGIGMPR